MFQTRMVVLFTDFGVTGPYVGQMKAAIWGLAPAVPVIDLFSDAPRYDPVAAAHLLAAYAGDFPAGTVFVGVVDPGVGTALRRPIVADIDGSYFVGPDNGLFDVVARRACIASKREIRWQPQRLSASFHGRDLFAPVAAKLASNTLYPEWLGEAEPFAIADEADELAKVIYIDGFGNVMTGLRAYGIAIDRKIEAGGQQIGWARTFAEAGEGELFWYENANGLLELAVNRGNAAERLALSLGDEISIV